MPRLKVYSVSGFKYAFSLSKDEVQAATPPGTTVLIGMSPTKLSSFALAARMLTSICKIAASARHQPSMMPTTTKSGSYQHHPGIQPSRSNPIPPFKRKKFKNRFL